MVRAIDASPVHSQTVLVDEMARTERSPVYGAYRCVARGFEPLAARPRASRQAQRARLIVIMTILTILLAGCAASPEAARVRGEPGADPGNHGNPVELLAPPDRFERIFSGIPYDGPSVASPDTAQS